MRTRLRCTDARRLPWKRAEAHDVAAVFAIRKLVCRHIRAYSRNEAIAGHFSYVIATYDRSVLAYSDDAADVEFAGNACVVDAFSTSEPFVASPTIPPTRQSFELHFISP